MHKPFLHIILPLILLFLPLSNVLGQDLINNEPKDYLQQSNQIYLTPIQEAKVRQYHEETIYFYVPASLNTLSAYLGKNVEAASIISIQVKAVRNLPLGMNWFTEFNHNGEGQIKLSGTPIQAGYYPIDFDFIIHTDQQDFVVTQCKDFLVRTESFGNTIQVSPLTGCENLEIYLTNTTEEPIEGITHRWRFGDGQESIKANPLSHTYTSPGRYLLQYQKEVDTFGLLLNRLTISEVLCKKQNPSFFSWDTKPDLYFIIRNDKKQIVFRSNNIHSNAVFPLDLYPQLKMTEASFSLEIWDKNGRNDNLCTIVPFDANSPAKVQVGGTLVEFEFIHPVERFEESYEIIVSSSIEKPSIQYTENTFCEGANLAIGCPTEGSIVWYKNGIPISNAQDSLLVVQEAGVYEVAQYNNYGCVLFSEPLVIEESPLPVKPVIVQDKNLLAIDGKTLPTGEYSYQWFLENTPLDLEQSPSLCILESGLYSLKITNQATGCSNMAFYELDYDHNYDCNIPLSDMAHINQSLHVFPSFARGNYCVNFNLNQSKNIKITITNLEGAVVFSEQLRNFEGDYFKVIDMTKEKQKQSFYNLEILVDKSTIRRSLLLP